MFGAFCCIDVGERGAERFKSCRLASPCKDDHIRDGVIQQVLKLDGDKAILDGKRKMLETANGSQASRLQTEIEALETKIEEAEATITTKENRIFSNS